MITSFFGLISLLSGKHHSFDHALKKLYQLPQMPLIHRLFQQMAEDLLPIMPFLDPSRVRRVSSNGTPPKGPPKGPQPLSGPQVPKLPSLGLSTITKLSPKGFLPLIPLFLWTLYKSEEKHLHNISLNINAMPAGKIYRVLFGTKDKAGGIAFEAARGKEVRFLHQRDVQKNTRGSPPPLFETENKLTSSKSPLWQMKNFIWKRQSHYLLCDVIINDSENPHLQNGPQIYEIPFSNREIFRIIHQDPHISTSMAQEDDSINGNPNEFTSMNTLLVNIQNSDNLNENIQQIPLGFSHGRHKAYLTIEQEF